MNIGEKILELRKENNLSQEQLAEKLDVARQTISKWELSETCPNIEQAKQLSNLFNISLDELVGNDIKDSIVNKISNTERLAGLTIKILKGFLVLFAALFILTIAAFILFSANSSDTPVGKYTFDAKLNGETYYYAIEYNKKNQIISGGGDAWIDDHIDIDKYSDADSLAPYIVEYFESRNGTCIVSEEMYK